MRICFSGLPLAGHLFPMLPLADAAARAGHEVAFLTGADAAGLLPDRRVLAAGPSVAEGMAETARRTGADGRDPGASAIELFGGVRLDLAGNEALDAARAFGPDLVVHEVIDRVGVLVAAALGVPRVVHGLSGPMPPELLSGIDARATRALTERGLVATARVALVDPFPEALLDDAERDASPDRLAIRPWVHQSVVIAGHGGAPGPRDLPRRADRPLVLVSLGTSVDEPAILAQLVEAVLGAGVDALVTHERPDPSPTAGPADSSSTDRRSGPQAHWLGFVPLYDLLGGVDAVVSAGGTGTLLAALTHGLPLVVRPFLADQPWNATRMVAHGVAVAVQDPRDAGSAVRAVLTEPPFRTAARRVAAAVAATSDANHVWGEVQQRLAAVRHDPAVAP